MAAVGGDPIILSLDESGGGKQSRNRLEKKWPTCLVQIIRFGMAVRSGLSYYLHSTWDRKILETRQVSGQADRDKKRTKEGRRETPIAQDTRHFGAASDQRDGFCG